MTKLIVTGLTACLMLTLSLKLYANPECERSKQVEELRNFMKECQGCNNELEKVRTALSECSAFGNFIPAWYQDPPLIAGFAFMGFIVGTLVGNVGD